MRLPLSGQYLDNPAQPLLQAHISYWGITDAAGNAAGTTVVCAGLATEPSYAWLSIKILDGGAAGQVRPITGHLLNTISVDIPFTNALGVAQQIGANTRFVILSAGGGGGGGQGLVSVRDTHNHADNLLEQQVFLFPFARPIEVETIYLDLVNLTQNAIIRVNYAIDGVNLRTIMTFNWTVGMDDGVFFREITVDDDVQVTLQSTALEGAIRNVPYQYLTKG